jgi:Tfp pilus assembly protein PilV
LCRIKVRSVYLCYLQSVGNRRHKAFSLLEVVVGTFIFLVVLGAMQGYWLTVSRMMEQSRARMAASFVAEQLMEDILAKGYDRTDEIAPSGNLGLDVTMYGKPKHYSIKYTVTIIDVNDELKSVEINLSSTGGQDLRFETLLAKGI